MKTVRRLFLVSLALLAPLAPAPALQKPAAPKGEALLERVAVIGASVSAGFMLGADAHKIPLNLSRVIEAGLIAKHSPVLNASDEMTFIDTLGSSKSAAKALAKDDPTLVVALDYLFWFGYGATWGGEKERLSALEMGLKSLEGLECPILLGDFPDMSSATKVKHPILPAQAVPDPATLAKLNDADGHAARGRRDARRPEPLEEGHGVGAAAGGRPAPDARGHDRVVALRGRASVRSTQRRAAQRAGAQSWHDRGEAGSGPEARGGRRADPGEVREVQPRQARPLSPCCPFS
jgi:hypothetical protein